MTKEDATLVQGALDTLGCALTAHDHQWTEGERAIYEIAGEILAKEAKSTDATTP